MPNLNSISSYLGLFNRFWKSTSLWDRDWDIACILDGCRLDTFRHVYGSCEAIRSVASTSQTWLPRTFSGHETRVGLISANPYTPRLAADRFALFHVEPVTETKYGIETVPPETLTRYAIDTWRRRNDLGFNRLVVHYMQPHVPFRSRPEWFSNYLGTDTWGSKEWQSLASGEVDREDWFAAYRDNLRWVIKEGVELLLENVNGDIAITADHGNAAGEWGFYGHPRGCPAAVVRKVPWVVEPGTNEGTVSGEPIPEGGELDVDHQLAALGYR